MSTPIDAMNTSAYAAWIGLDWADQKHFWVMRTAGGQTQRGELRNTPEAVEIWAAELAQRFPGRPIALALEQSRGAVISMLSKYAHLVLFPVHSSTLANYRKAFSPCGAKGDPSDADLILDLLIKHSDRLRPPGLVQHAVCLRTTERPLQPDTVETRSLQFLTEERRKLVDQQTSESQRLTNWLKQVFPQILQLFDDPASPLVGDLLLRWPSLQALQKASDKTLRTFLQQHNCRSEERIQQRLDQIRQAVPATTDPALLETATLCIENSVRALAQIRTGIQAFDRRIAEIYHSHPDRPIMESFPGAGPALEPRLIAAVGTQRERFDSAQNLACFTGIAPVKQSSGNSCWIHWRWACPKFIRQTFHEWAGCSIRSCDWARAFYEHQRGKGKGHHAAIRSLAFKWIRIFFRCWRDRVPYSAERYQKALQVSAAVAGAPQPAPFTLEISWKSCGGLSKPVKIS